MFTRTFRALRVRNYRLFWFGQLVSQTGTWMQTVGQAWLVLQISDSPLALGAVTMLQFLPILLFTLFGGVLADRLPKRRVLIVTQSLAGSVALAMGLLVSAGLIQIWQVYLLAFSFGAITALDNPTRQAFVVEMVGREDLPNAVALNSSLFNGARTVGPALAGLVIAFIRVEGCFYLNVASYLAALTALLLMWPAEFFSVPRLRGAASLFGRLAEGLRYSRRTPAVLAIMLLVGFIGTFGYNFSVVLPLLGRYVLRTDGVGFGLLNSSLGAGSLLAALGLAYLGRARRPVVFAGATAFSLLLALVGLSPWLPLTLVLLLALGMAGIVFSATAQTLLQLLAPDDLRGRVSSLYFLLFAGSTPIGAFCIGTLAERWTIQGAVLAAASLCLLGVGLGLLYDRRHGQMQIGAQAAGRPLPSATTQGITGDKGVSGGGVRPS